MVGFASVLAAFVTSLAVAFPWTVTPTEPPVDVDARPPTDSVEHIHKGHVLCVDYDIIPVARFKEHYTDAMGNHYHGWTPPGGPPFYVECFNAAEEID